MDDSDLIQHLLHFEEKFENQLDSFFLIQGEATAWTAVGHKHLTNLKMQQM